MILIPISLQIGRLPQISDVLNIISSTWRLIQLVTPIGCRWRCRWSWSDTWKMRCQKLQRRETIGSHWPHPATQPLVSHGNQKLPQVITKTEHEFVPEKGYEPWSIWQVSFPSQWQLVLRLSGNESIYWKFIGQGCDHQLRTEVARLHLSQSAYSHSHSFFLLMPLLHPAITYLYIHFIHFFVSLTHHMVFDFKSVTHR